MFRATPRGGCAAAALLAILAAGCAAPARTDGRFTALEPPVLSPPGEWPAAERLAWWEQRLPTLGFEDRLEARLCMGELLLELGRAEEARYAFYEASAGEVSAREAARAERGVGLSWFLEGQPARGASHLHEALAGLETPAADEARALIAAAEGRAQTADAATLARVAPWLEAAGLVAAAAPAPASASLADVTRAQWNAEKLRANHDPMAPPFRITVHHTAEPITSDALAASCSEVRHIQSMHLQQGWADVGYHFLIDRAGRVIEGRPLTAQGAHAGNSEVNRGNVGIALLGNFVAQPERGSEYARPQTPTAAQMQALDRLTDALIAKYGISPREVWAHDHFRETECPGPQLRGWADARRAGRRPGAAAAASPAAARGG